MKTSSKKTLGSLLSFFLAIMFVMGMGSKAFAVERRLHIDAYRVTNAESIAQCNTACPNNQPVCLIAKIVETGDCATDFIIGGVQNSISQNVPFFPLSIGDGVAYFAINTKLNDVNGNTKSIQGTVAAVTDQIETSNTPSFDQFFTLIDNFSSTFWPVCLNPSDPASCFDPNGRPTHTLNELVPYMNPWKDADETTLNLEGQMALNDPSFSIHNNEATFGDIYGGNDPRPMGFSKNIDPNTGLPEWMFTQQTSHFRADIHDQINFGVSPDQMTRYSTGYFLGKKGYIICRCFYDNYSFTSRTGFGGCNHCQYIIVWQDDDATKYVGKPKV